MSLIKLRKKVKKIRPKKNYLWLVSYNFYYWGKNIGLVSEHEEYIPIKVVDSKKHADLYCQSKNFEFQSIIFADHQTILDYEQEEDNPAIKENIKLLKDMFLHDIKKIQKISESEIWCMLDNYPAYCCQRITYDSTDVVD